MRGAGGTLRGWRGCWASPRRWTRTWGPPCIDTPALERELERLHGPMPDGESMADFVGRRYGAEAVAAIARLLDGRELGT